MFVTQQVCPEAWPAKRGSLRPGHIVTSSRGSAEIVIKISSAWVLNACAALVLRDRAWKGNVTCCGPDAPIAGPLLCPLLPAPAAGHHHTLRQ